MEDGQLVYDFYGGGKGEVLAARVQEVVDEVRGKGADYVVVISHLGVNEPSYDTVSFIHMTKGVDVFLDGHMPTSSRISIPMPTITMSSSLRPARS